MTKRTRRAHSATLKAKVALDALKGEKTLAELAQQYEVRASQITAWKAQLLAGVEGVFGCHPSDAAPAVVRLPRSRGRFVDLGATRRLLL